MSELARGGLALEEFYSAGAVLINVTKINENSFPLPPKKTSKLKSGEKALPHLVLVEIPADFPALKNANLELALAWRTHTSAVFVDLFELGYIVTDFTFIGGELPRSFYVLSNVNAKLGE